MVLRINPAHFALWKSNNSLQIGQGETAVHLDEVSPAQHRLISLLQRGIPSDSIEALARSSGETVAATNNLLERLRPTLLQGESGVKTTIDQDFIEQAFAEIIRASFNTSTDGLAVLGNRAAQRVQLIDADSTACLLALGLASAGLGSLESPDLSVVTPQDVGPLGYAADEVGRPRAQALARRLEVGAHPCRVYPATKRQPPALAVLTGSQLTKTESYERLIHGRVPHLAIEFQADQTVVSPIVIPGVTPCLSCRYRFETEKDALWPLITAQLQMREERLDDSQSKLFACGISLGLILDFLDGQQDTGFVGSYLNHRTGEIGVATWGFDKSCTCASKQSH